VEFWKVVFVFGAITCFVLKSMLSASALAPGVYRAMIDPAAAAFNFLALLTILPAKAPTPAPNAPVSDVCFATSVIVSVPI
jgi:hypothetical protein